MRVKMRVKTIFETEARMSVHSCIGGWWGQ